MNLDDKLRDKQAANGAFEDTAQLAQAIKFVLRRGRNWEGMGPESKEALEQISTQIGKILNGDAGDWKHWLHLAGYAQLRARALDVDANDEVATSISRLARMRVEKDA